MGEEIRQEVPSAKTKPVLSFWQIWNMSFGFMGIQFGFALQNANVSRIFETLGANVEDIPILWIAAPVTGLIIQPITPFIFEKSLSDEDQRKGQTNVLRIIICKFNLGPAEPRQNDSVGLAFGREGCKGWLQV